jgi:hypothetical protein
VRGRTSCNPDEISGGTYTLTNVGTFGNVLGTPVINQPQVAIMATGAIRKKPAVLETPAGDVIAIRHLMFLSHSYDHRVVDGALGGKLRAPRGRYPGRLVPGPETSEPPPAGENGYISQPSIPGLNECVPQ